MKVELVVPSLPAAGMEVMVGSLQAGLAARGHDVGITCLDSRGTLGEQLANAGVRVSVVSAEGWPALLFPTNLVAHFRSLRPDVVHIHSGALAKAVRGARLAGVPRVVYTMHGLNENGGWYATSESTDARQRIGEFIERLASRPVSTLVAVSEPVRDYWLGQRFPASRIEVIPNGIDTTRFQPGPRSLRIHERFGLGPDDFVIGHVARFSPVKNQALLLKAFAIVLREQPNAFLALVGDGPLRSEIESLAEQLGIRNRTGFFGLTFESEAIYRDFDVFVLSSHIEQTSMSILEAMSSGIPVVATAVGGTPAVLANGDTGKLVPPGDADAMARALLSLARDPAQRKTLAERGRQRVLAEYAQDVMLDRYEAVYAGSPGLALKTA